MTCASQLQGVKVDLVRLLVVLTDGKVSDDLTALVFDTSDDEFETMMMVLRAGRAFSAVNS